MQIQIHVNDTEVNKALSDLSARMRNLKPVMREIGEIVRTSVERNFAAGGRPKWGESARVKREGGQTLSLTGSLRRSFARTDAVQAGNDRVSVGTNVVYAAIHQLGGKTSPTVITPKKAKALFWPGARHPVKSVNHPGSVIPPRPFLMVQNEDWTEIKNVINRYLSVR
ncbi:MAG TPA: phage virion morphogenesis protein [Syntrophales bacterium]|nr:phage virion morphogenesis protein [Syntrophales bacterium]